MNKRIRYLREDKSLSRAAFGKKLGVSGDVINNLERGRVELKDHMIKLICSEFSLNEDWLRNGTEPMYIQAPSFSLDDFVKKRGGTELELEIAKIYFDLEPDFRKTLVQHFSDRLISYTNKKISVPIPDTPEELEALYPPVSDPKTNAG